MKLVVPFFKWLLPKGYSAITLFPFIILTDKTQLRDECLLRHEKIHLKQQSELLILPFYLLYLSEFMFHLLRTSSFHRAYRSISFEKEAYLYQNRSNYLSRRKLFGMWRKSPLPHS